MQGGHFINQKLRTMIFPARFLVFTLLSLISVVLKCANLPPVLKNLLSFGFGIFQELSHILHQKDDR